MNSVAEYRYDMKYEVWCKLNLIYIIFGVNYYYTINVIYTLFDYK